MLKKCLFLSLLVVAGCQTAIAPQPVNTNTASQTPTPRTKPPDNCVVTGCNGELCAEPGQAISSICIFREEYTCYKTATCERQADGQCGWTQTAELTACIESKR